MNTSANRQLDKLRHADGGVSAVPAAAAYLGHPKTLSKRTKDLQLSLRPEALEQAKEVRTNSKPIF